MDNDQKTMSFAWHIMEIERTKTSYFQRGLMVGLASGLVIQLLIWLVTS